MHAMGKCIEVKGSKMGRLFTEASYVGRYTAKAIVMQLVILFRIPDFAKDGPQCNVSMVKRLAIFSDYEPKCVPVFCLVVNLIILHIILLLYVNFLSYNCGLHGGKYYQYANKTVLSSRKIRHLIN